MVPLESLLQSEAWTQALDKYASATRLTAAVYDRSHDLILGPVRSTALFKAACGSGQTMLLECVGRCLEHDEPTPVIVERSGIAVVGSRLAVEGDAVGAVVAGYALTAFPAETAVRQFALNTQVPFGPLWRAAREQTPLTKERLGVYAELLRALTDSLLNENFRMRQYQQAAESLGQANRAKDEFLAMLSHELRNPLGPIQVAMQVISSGHADASTVRRARETVDRQVKQMARLLDDLLDVSRITRGVVALQKEPVNLTTAVANALETARPAIEACEHGLTVSLPEESVVIEADPIRLEQIIVNLVNNAAKYTPPKGRILVSVSRDHDDVVLRVRDNGIGISEELLPRVFDLFKQGDRSLVRSGGGLGIGLTIVQNLVALHGGSVTAHSDGLGSGSEFIVRLPIGAAGPMREKIQEQPAGRAIRFHVLVIEDDVDSREMLRTCLELEGHRVEVAQDGLSGVDAARTIRPDIVLTDVGLPGLDGYEVARQIRTHLGNDARLIALTGYGQPEDRRRAIEAGFDALLVKPVSPEDLSETLSGLPRGEKLA
jgi:signal transduction histidine kinase/CheY-like chemotaxis protein